MKKSLSRKKFLQSIGVSGLGLMAAPLIPLAASQENMRKRAIPSSGEELSIVGLGTWTQFDVGPSSSQLNKLRKVLQVMVDYGGQVIDSSPMYGQSQKVIGDLTTDLEIDNEFFYATKVWTSGQTAGVKQMNTSMQEMQRSTMDLMQVHNLLDWKTHLQTLQEWKENGKVRYIGVTHHTNSSHEQLEEIIKTEDIDFVQFNYSIAERNAAEQLLPTAKDQGVAVLINEPYGGGALFSAAKGKSLPDWAGDFDINSWGQYFLKYILGHPAVTCVIPGTSDPEHTIDNMMAGYGRMPDADDRKRMLQYFQNL